MILLPLSHEKLSVQRLPWVTMGIIALNILLFLVSLYVAKEERKELEAKAVKVQEYYLQHPYLKLSDYILERFPPRLRKLLDQVQEELAKKKETANQKLAAYKEKQEAQIKEARDKGAKYLLQLKERRMTARSTRERDVIDKEIDRVEQQLEKLKKLGETGTDIKGITSVQEEQAELDRLMQDLQKSIQSTFTYQYGLIPNNMQWYAFLTSMFLHGGWLHLLGNMFFLWLSGCNIEDLWGRAVYPLFYIFGGVAGALGHVLVVPTSQIPLIGASGAIAAVMGAFAVRLYNTRITFFYFFWTVWGTFLAPAWIMLLLWLLQNILLHSLSGGVSGVAYMAHVGGFIFGAIVATTLKLTGVEEKYLAPAIEKKVGVFKQHPKVVSGIEKLDQGKVDTALVEFKAALRDNPQDADARHQLVEVYRRKNQPDLAQQELKSLLGLYMRKNQGDLAAQTYLELKALNPQGVPDSKDALSIAQMLEKQAYFSEALGEYYALYKNNPTGPSAVRSLIRCGNLLVEKLGQPQQACQAFEAAQNLAGNDPLWATQIQEGLEKAKSKIIQPMSAGIEVVGVVPLSVSTAAEASTPVYYRGVSAEADLGATMAEEVAARARQIQAHRVKVSALSSQGLQVITKDGRQGIFPWEKVKGIFVAQVMPPPPQKGVYLFLDIIIGKSETPQVLEVRTMRINGAELSYKDLIDDPLPQGMVNFKKFTTKILNLCPRAVALPNLQHVTGNPFKEYNTPEAYESDLGLWVERKL